MPYPRIGDRTCPVHTASPHGFSMSMAISAYSLISLARRAKGLMPQSGSILAMTYLGGEKVIPRSNLMGHCKSALESAVEYSAHELGRSSIRVNAISAG